MGGAGERTEMNVLLVGCGYVGMRLGADLAAAGHAVYGLRRSRTAEAEMEAAGIRMVQGDITDASSLRAIPEGIDWVVNLVSSTRGGAAEYERVYVEGTRNLLEQVERRSLRKYVQVSSTSVYGQTDGSWVDEQSPTEPASATSRLLVQAEEWLRRQSADWPVVILRAAGIYGPGRGHLFQQFLRGDARRHGEGRRFLNMIHLADLASGIKAALEEGAAGETYNITDDLPVTEHEFLAWLAGELGRPLPPTVSEERLSERKRGYTNKRVSNAKAKQGLRWQPSFATYREGYAEAVRQARATA